MESSEIGPYRQELYQKAAVAAATAATVATPTPAATVATAATAARQWQGVVPPKDKIWSQQQYGYNQLRRERVPPRSHPSDGYHRGGNVPKRPPLIGKIPPLLDKIPPRLPDKKQPLLARPDKGGYSKYNNRVDSRVYNESRSFSRVYNESHSFSRNRRRGHPHTHHHESGYRGGNDDSSTSRHPNYKGMKNSFRRKRFYSSHYSREWFYDKRRAPFFKESPADWKNTPVKQSSSNMSNRSYSREQSRAHDHHSHNRRKERYERYQSFQRSRGAACSSSSAVSSSKVVDKANRLTEKKRGEAENKLANKMEKSEKINVAEIPKFEAQSKALSSIEQREEPKGSSNVTDGSETCNNNQFNSHCENQRNIKIAMKTKEIEQVYRHDCETFGMVVKMLIDKDPSLEKSIQFSLKENLREIGERCIQELKRFITAFDNSTQDAGRPL